MTQFGDTIGPYTLVQNIGHGSFGVVWLAERRTVINTLFALKLAREENVDMEVFRREAVIWARAHRRPHPNVLPIIEADVYDGQVVIVSEYAPDGSLTKWLRQHDGKTPPVAAAVEMALQILSGLEHLHGQRIIHRDIKPDNILLQCGTPLLADFGLACLRQTNSYSQAARGTPAYMAPEAFDGKRNEQTDLWSVGVVLYQMLAGRLPYEVPNLHELHVALKSRKPTPLPASIPKSLRRVVARALKRRPARRYKSADEMRRALLSVSREMWPRTAPPAEVEESAVVPWLRKAVIAFSLCAVIVAFVLWRYYTRREVPEDRPPVIAVPQDGRMLATANDKNNVELCDVMAGEFKLTLNRDGSPVHQMRFSPDGNILAVVSDGVIELWDTKTGAGRQAFPGYKASAVYTVAITSDNKLLIVVAPNGSTDQRDIKP